ncbi:hypothetical protein HDV03_005191 [Kappamyces sp. JEL0829]|nr:hypothetical protein HDV03_005191 [Kappamyces sp. JEL0829]
MWWKPLDTTIFLTTLNLLFVCLFKLSLRSIGTYDLSRISDSEIVSHVQWNVLLEHFQMDIGTFAVSSYVAAIVSSGGRELNPKTGLVVFRIFVFVFKSTVTYLWVSVGLSSFQLYVFYRRLEYLFIAAGSLTVSAPMIYIFGRRVILQFGREQPPLLSQETAATQQSIANRDAGSPAAMVARKQSANEARNADRVGKIFWLKFGVYGVLAVYLTITIQLLLYVVGFEAFLDDHGSQFIIKCIVDTYFVFFCSWFSIVLYKKR